MSFAPIVMDFDATTSTYTVTDSQKDVARETTWRLIAEMGAIDGTPRSTADIARIIGLAPVGQKLTGAHRKRISDALAGRPEIGIVQENRRGQKTTLDRRLEAL